MPDTDTDWGSTLAFLYPSGSETHLPICIMDAISISLMGLLNVRLSSHTSAIDTNACKVNTRERVPVTVLNYFPLENGRGTTWMWCSSLGFCGTVTGDTSGRYKGAMLDQGVSHVPGKTGRDSESPSCHSGQCVTF